MEMAAQQAPVVFDKALADRGFWINRFCMGSMDEATRQAFKRDEVGYLARFPLSSEQTAPPLPCARVVHGRGPPAARAKSRP